MCLEIKSADVCSPNTFKERSLLSGDRHLLSSLSELFPKLERTPLASPLLPGFLSLPPDVQSVSQQQQSAGGGSAWRQQACSPPERAFVTLPE